MWQRLPVIAHVLLDTLLRLLCRSTAPRMLERFLRGQEAALVTETLVVHILLSIR